MVRILSVPMFVASCINFLFFLFYLLFCFRVRKDQKYYKSYIIFSILSFVNSVYSFNFGILLNSKQNLEILNISNRITIIASTIVIVLFIHFVIAFFDIKGREIVYFLYIMNFCFSILTVINTPHFLFKEFYNTSRYYTGLKFGILFQLWGSYMILLLILSLLFLISGYLKVNKDENQQKYPILILLTASIFWIIGGGFDALTAIQLVDFPPMSWIGSLSIGMSIAIVLIVSIEKLHEKNDQLYKEVIHDNLTNAFSRSYFEVQFDKIYNLLNRIKNNNFLVLLDVDNFKEVNDNFGHLAGDFILKELSKIIRESLRNTDIFGRYGGDEFVILINDITDDENALNLIERIRKNINENLFVYKNQVIKVSCSFGVAHFNFKTYEKKISKEDIIAVADIALYKSKDLGKNRVEVLDPLIQKV